MSTQDKFWETLGQVRTGLIQVTDNSAPMTHFCDQSNQCLYFVTSQGTQAADAAEQSTSAKYLICSDKEGLYADINGQLSIETSREKLADIWNLFAAAWFDGDMNDPSIRLLRMDLADADVWFATGNPIAFFYQIAKGNFTEEQPDLGSHQSFNFKPG